MTTSTAAAVGTSGGRTPDHTTPSRSQTMTDPQTDLRERIAAAVDEGFRLYAELEDTSLGNSITDSVLAALPAVPVPPTTHAVDRAAVLREAAAELGRMDYDTDSNDYGYDTYRDAWNGGVMDGADLLRRMADEAQQQEGSATSDTALDLTDGPVRCPLCPWIVTLHTPSGARAHFTTVHPEQRLVGSGPWPLLVTDGDEARRQPDTETQTPAEHPARIDRLRPEFTEHSSVEAIDVQIDRARSQQRRWHLRTEWLISLRQRREQQQARGEWPASGPGRVADEEQPETGDGPRTVCVCGHTRGEHITVSGRLLCDTCVPDSTDNLVCKEFEAL